MRLTKTKLDGVVILEPQIFEDARGYFVETYNKKTLADLGLHHDFIQDNQSKSMTIGTIRGLHFQHKPYEQTKLVRCVSGAIFDVAVDLRLESATYGQWVGVVLSDENHRQLLIPKGFAHGFCTLEPDTVVAYKVDAYYSSAHDDGILYNDASIGIQWPMLKPILSDKDKSLQRLTDTPEEEQ